jgi:hypothetical protein
MASSTTGRYSVTGEKVRENRLRRMADRQGLQLVKSRRRDPRAVDYGTYALYVVDAEGLIRRQPPFTHAELIMLERGGGLRLTLDQVEAILTGGGE